MIAMHRLPVESSDIVSIGYDEAARILEIEFQNERVYRYRDVEPDVHAQLMRADSYGQFFSTFITKRYRFERVGKDDRRKNPDTIAFVTNNTDKFIGFRAACELFAIKVDQVVLPVDEIQSEDAEDIAVKKAKQAHKLASQPVVVNDSFWNILALRGFPGAFMSYVADWLRAEDFLKLMEGKTDRDILLTETIAYYDGKRSKVFSKEFRGSLTDRPQGTDRVSINQIVVFAGQTQTIAEAKQTGNAVIDPKETAAYDFARWFNMYRKTGR